MGGGHAWRLHGVGMRRCVGRCYHVVKGLKGLLPDPSGIPNWWMGLTVAQ